MSLTKTTYLQQQENKTNNGRLSLAVPHSDLSATFNIFISGGIDRILMLNTEFQELNSVEPEPDM